MHKVLALSSSLLTERILLHSSLVDDLAPDYSLHLWTTSDGNLDYARSSNHANLTVEPFPAVKAFKEYPFNYLRRLNEYIWDYRLRPPSRMSMMKHVRDRAVRAHIRALKLPARVFAALRMESLIENNLEYLLLAYPRSAEGLQRLKALAPDVLLTTSIFGFDEPAISAAAKKLGIPTLAFITSWDNPSTKNRPVFKYDGYLVWSEKMKSEMHEFFPYTRETPIYVTGAPQFDVFFDARFDQSREEFCLKHGLDPKLPIVLYALGSPNLFNEMPSVIHLADSTARGELGAIQFLVRPHPLHDKGLEVEALRRFGERVIVQSTGLTGMQVARRAQNEDQIRDWVNTFRHAAVVVNLSSTSAIDAAIFDRPVVNLDYDPDPSKSKQQMVKEVNHQWTHFKPIAESGGLRLVDNPAEMIEAVKAYLARPELHRERRRWLAEHVCGFLDGKSGERMAKAIIDFAEKFEQK